MRKYKTVKDFLTKFVDRPQIGGKTEPLFR